MFIYLVCKWGHVYAAAYTWEPKNNLQVFVLSLYLVSVGDETQMFRLGVGTFACWAVLLIPTCSFKHTKFWTAMLEAKVKTNWEGQMCEHLFSPVAPLFPPWESIWVALFVL